MEKSKQGKLKKLIIQIIKFGGVGIVCTIFEYVIFAVMFSAMGIDRYVSQGVSFGLSTVLNYFLTMAFVFKRDEKHSHIRDFVIFVVLSVVGLLISEGVTKLGEMFFTAVAGNCDGILAYIVKICATCIVMVFNFVTRKILLEKKEDDAENTEKQ